MGAVNDFMQYIYRLENADTSAKPEDILVSLRGQIKDIDKIVKS